MLYDKLKSEKRIPMHMPGHKRNTDLLGSDFPYDIDITEIDGFDNLHCPKGIIADIQQKISKLYNSKKSYILVNGSTAGILAAVSAVVGSGDTVLMARNCHKSVYNAVELAKARTLYITPGCDEYGIEMKAFASQVEEIIVNNPVKLIVVTSPTYEGVASDTEGICDIAHKFHIPVLLDAAHGAHFFQSTGADIVIMSLHKTLPALTQCAVANINGDIVNPRDFEIKLSVFQTSSPSYILMSSVEKCVDFVNNSQPLFFRHSERIHGVYEQLKALKHLKFLKYDDINKLVVYTGGSNISGKALADILRKKYNIEIEMAANNYIVAITTVCDREEDLKLFADALLHIDKSLVKGKADTVLPYELPVKKLEACDIGKITKALDIKSSLGRISGEYVWAYPPGVPIIVPGEVIDNNVIKLIDTSIKNGIDIQSTYNLLPDKICCI